MSVFDDLYDKAYDGVLRLMGREPVQKATSLPFPGMTARGVKGATLGQHLYVEAPPEFDASSMQVCGFWPFSVGASTALVGAPLGKHFYTGAPVCGDPMTAFKRGIVSAPSSFVLALNGRGKSSLVIRICLYLMGLGDLVLVAGDLKPDYVGLVQSCGGMVFALGRGGGSLNVLDAGPWAEHLDRLPAAKQAEMRERVHGRRVNALSGLVEMVLRRDLSEESSETTVLSVAIQTAADEAATHGAQPLPADVLRVITERHPNVRRNILEMTDAEYDQMTAPLRKGLNGLGPHGPFGDVFCRQTSQRVPIDVSLCFDVSGIPSTDAKLRAAVQLACWSYAQSVSECAKILASEGLEPERHHLNVMDELWQILEAWDGSVTRINAITRLNRTEGLGQMMITHSMKDLELSTPERTKMARGFVERSSVLYLGGLARNEMKDLLSVRPFSQKEQDLLVSWSSEGSMNPITGEVTPPAGRGKFMMKTGDAPGVPFTTGRTLTPAEKKIHDTNDAWRAAMGVKGE